MWYTNTLTSGVPANATIARIGNASIFSIQENKLGLVLPPTYVTCNKHVTKHYK